MATWRPVLEGSEREQALEIARDVAAALRDRPEEHPEPGLAGGDSGIAMLYGYLHEVDPDAGWAEEGEKRLERAIDAVAERPMGSSLYSGFTGVAWVTEHLVPSAPGEDDANEQIDDALAQHLTISPWQADYDLIVGLTGFGLYAVDRLVDGADRPMARACAVRTVDRLEEIVQEKDGGLTWWTPPYLLIPETRERYPNGYYNLGVAHGNPAVLTLLALLLEKGIEPERARRLLAGNFAWLTAHRNKPGVSSRYGYSISDAHEDGHSRLAWCYGDIGIAAALLWAARTSAAGDLAAPLEAEAIATAEASLAREPDDAGCIDAGICHGTVGLALLWSRLYNATGDERYRDAARLWYARTLAMRKPGTGIGGYQCWGPGGEDRKLSWIDDPGVLTGSAGIAMALLAGATELEPRWDRMLMTSVPVR